MPGRSRGLAYQTKRRHQEQFFSRRALGLAAVVGGALGFRIQAGALARLKVPMPPPSGTMMRRVAGTESIKRGTLTVSVAQQVILAVEGKTVTALA